MNQVELTDMDTSRKKKSQSGLSEASEIPYPKAVFFIIATELSERFSYYGMRAVLTIYMRNMLNFSEDNATIIYHTFLMLCYSLPLIFGIIADSFLGKFTTIWIVSICFAVGNTVLTLSSISSLHLPAISLTILGLVLMSIGTGGMKPCVAPFGGDQFVVPQQNNQLQRFFSAFFFAMTIGNMISTVITPIFRRDVHCFGMDSCYPLAFGLPALIMIVAIGIFISGKSHYKIHKPKGNVLVQVFKCMTYALKKEKPVGDGKTHWLDRASDKYDATLINDIKGLLRVLVYYLPIPMFFALYEQLGSRWTLQATRMTGVIGSYTIIPDQMQVFNGILTFISIPVFQTVVYPIFAKCNLLKRPLQRMVVGGFLATLSFLVAGVIETQIEKSFYISPGVMETHVNFINTLPCPIEIQGHGINTSTINSENKLIIHYSNSLNADVILNEACRKLRANETNSQNKPWQGQIKLIPGVVQSIIIFKSGNNLSISNEMIQEDFKKSNEGNAKIRFSTVGLNNSSGLLSLYVELNGRKHNTKSFLTHPSHPIGENKTETDMIFPPSLEILPDLYKINYKLSQNGNTMMTGTLGETNLLTGGSYLIIVYPKNNQSYVLQKKSITLVVPNEIHMLYLVPQYVLIAWAEILFLISGMEFSFTQAPASMKSVLQSLWHLMNAFGNLIVIVSAKANHSDFQANVFYGFSGAMLIDSIIFCFLAMNYKYVTVPSNDDKNTYH